MSEKTFDEKQLKYFLTSKDILCLILIFTTYLIRHLIKCNLNIPGRTCKYVFHWTWWLWWIKSAFLEMGFLSSEDTVYNRVSGRSEENIFYETYKSISMQWQARIQNGLWVTPWDQPHLAKSLDQKVYQSTTNLRPTDWRWWSLSYLCS